MKHRVFLLFTFYFLFVSCHQEQTSVSPEEQANADSLALHVAVVPVMDCLPIYYAERMGLFALTEVDIRLHTYGSQMDSETALRNGDVEVAYTDIARVLELQGDSAKFRIIMGMKGKMSLVAAHTKRIRSLKHLRERMVALDRLSASDYWSDEILRQAGLEQADIYRPQINDLALRTAMLHEQLVDAALLPEPYATQAERQGNKRLFATNDTTPSFTALAVSTRSMADTLRAEQIRRFVLGYDKAVEELTNHPNNDTLRAILRQQYGLPAEMADSVQIPIYPQSHLPLLRDADIIMRWLESRERRIHKSARDSLFLQRFLSRP